MLFARLQRFENVTLLALHCIFAVDVVWYIILLTFVYEALKSRGIENASF